LVGEKGGSGAGGLDGGPDVLVHADGLVGAPDEAAGEEDEEEEEAVVELEAGAGEVELVEEPVDVEEGGGELVEDEGWGVEVDEGALEDRDSARLARGVADVCARDCRDVQIEHGVAGYGGRLTNPSENTISAAIACANMPHPKIPTCTALTHRSHKKYPAANPWIMPPAPVYPQTLPRQSIFSRSSSVHITHSASTFIKHDCTKDTAWTSQFNLVRLLKVG